MAGVAALEQSNAVMPFLYQASELTTDAIIPLTDLATSSSMDGGEVWTATLVYPAGAVPLGPTTSLQLLTSDNSGWRLTDIPVDFR